MSDIKLFQHQVDALESVKGFKNAAFYLDMGQLGENLYGKCVCRFVTPTVYFVGLSKIYVFNVVEPLPTTLSGTASV